MTGIHFTKFEVVHKLSFKTLMRAVCGHTTRIKGNFISLVVSELRLGGQEDLLNKDGVEVENKGDFKQRKGWFKSAWKIER